MKVRICLRIYLYTCSVQSGHAFCDLFLGAGYVLVLYSIVRDWSIVLSVVIEQFLVLP